jgi:hypothetical protein
MAPHIRAKKHEQLEHLKIIGLVHVETQEALVLVVQKQLFKHGHATVK